MSRRDLVLSLLRTAGPAGVTTAQFLQAGAGSRFGARVQELRDSGMNVKAERISAGSWRYILLSGQPASTGAGTASPAPRLFESSSVRSAVSGDVIEQ